MKNYMLSTQFTVVSFRPIRCFGSHVLRTHRTEGRPLSFDVLGVAEEDKTLFGGQIDDIHWDELPPLFSESLRNVNLYFNEHYWFQNNMNWNCTHKNNHKAVYRRCGTEMWSTTCFNRFWTRYQRSMPNGYQINIDPIRNISFWYRSEYLATSDVVSNPTVKTLSYPAQHAVPGYNFYRPRCNEIHNTKAVTKGVSRKLNHSLRIQSLLTPCGVHNS